MTQTTLKAIHPATEPGAYRDQLSLVFLVRNDFSDLSLNILGIGGLASKPLERITSSVDIPSLDKISWRIW